MILHWIEWKDLVFFRVPDVLCTLGILYAVDGLKCKNFKLLVLSVILTFTWLYNQLQSTSVSKEGLGEEKYAEDVTKFWNHWEANDRTGNKYKLSESEHYGCVFCLRFCLFRVLISLWVTLALQLSVQGLKVGFTPPVTLWQAQDSDWLVGRD